MANISSQGTVISRQDTTVSPIVFVAIPQVTNISGPDGSSTEITVTNLSSTAAEFVLGLKDEGSIGLDCIFDERNAVHAGLRTDFNAGTLRAFTIVDSDVAPKTYSFNAYVQGLSMTMGVDEVQRATINLRVSGAITIT